MSADNYYLVRKTPDGRYAVTLGFASDCEDPLVRTNDPRFDTEVVAIEYAGEQASEYGVFVGHFHDQPTDSAGERK